MVSRKKRLGVKIVLYYQVLSTYMQGFTSIENKYRVMGNWSEPNPPSPPFMLPKTMGTFLTNKYVKEKKTFLGTFLFQRSKLSKANKLEGGGG